MTTTSGFPPQTIGAGSDSEPKISLVQTRPARTASLIHRSNQCDSDHMVIGNAHCLTFRYSGFPFTIPLTALTAVLSRLQHTLADIPTHLAHPPQGVHPANVGSAQMHFSVGEESFGLPSNPKEATTHSQYYCGSLIREIVIISKEYNKNLKKNPLWLEAGTVEVASKGVVTSVLVKSVAERRPDTHLLSVAKDCQPLAWLVWSPLHCTSHHPIPLARGTSYTLITLYPMRNDKMNNMTMFAEKRATPSDVVGDRMSSKEEC